MEFATEIIENLDLLESSFLDALKRVEAIDTQVVGILFRYAHNTKGLLAMAGEETCRDSIHELETTLDKIRNGKALVTKEFGSLALDLISALRDAANDEGSSDTLVDIGKAIRCLREAEAAQSVVQKKPFPAIALGPTEESAIRAARTAGHNLFVIEKLVSTGTPETEWRALPIFEDIKSFGTLIHAGVVGAQSEDGAMTVRLLIATAMPAADLEFVVFDPHYEVEYPKALASIPTGRSTKDAPTQKTERIHSPTAKAAAEGKRLRVLIVDDELTSRHVLESFFRSRSDYEVVCNGREALMSFMFAIEEGAPFDLVCLDISMPVMTGTNALDLLRRLERERGIDGKDQCPVLMISSERAAPLIAKSFFQSCDLFLHKPVKLADIEAALQKLGLDAT